MAAEGYGRIDANVGSFAVKIEGIEPYGDGVRVQLQIGNLSSATFNGGALDVSWGPRSPAFEGGDTTYWRRFYAWRGALSTDTIRFTDRLRPGAWNDVGIVLPATRSDEFGYLTVGISTDQISLGR